MGIKVEPNNSSVNPNCPKAINKLFSDIPSEIRITSELPLRGPQTEEQIISDARDLLGSNIAIFKGDFFIICSFYFKFFGKVKRNVFSNKTSYPKD